MQSLERLFRKKKKRIIGLMSGTSADGIDAVCIEVTGSGPGVEYRQIAFQMYPYPAGFKQFLLENSNPATARLDDITRLDMLIATFFADAVKKIARSAGYRISDIDLIGSHGQTIQHLPEQKKLFGKPIRSTLQIGNPSAIAKLTGVVVIGDFRVGDVAVGGSGAPLVPLFDYLVFRSSKINRAALNIGGIANITVLPKKCAIENVVAFDTGPGNMVIDRLTQHFYSKAFDQKGEIAKSGEVLSPLLSWMYHHPYLKLKPPKSTGREMFGEEFVAKILQHARSSHPEDIVTTVTEFTALSVYDSYCRFIRRNTGIGELIVSGGGVHNQYLMDSLRRYFDGVSVRTADELGLSSDAKEAICFALLANETIAGRPGNVPGATGAKQQTVIGSICLP